MNWNFLIFPIIGAIIGALTNQVAIRMLFRPYKPIMVFGWRLPFTPGVIPAQRRVIAKNIAEVFEENLLSGQDIKEAMTGVQVKKALRSHFNKLFSEFSFLENLMSGLKETLIEYITHSMSDLVEEIIRDGGELHIASRIEEKINGMDIRDLENLVLGISSNHFRYITVFGGILGALIGFTQAVINYYLWN